ncbi:MAG: hypothetical protein IMZ44_23800 [Planctomycetes bacterium]|nr:hypothetical protein [Planctomycetota bacterium]
MARACLVLCLLAIAAPLAWAADAEKAAEAAAAFESLYGADLKRVRATRDLKDDLDLAARLLAAARQAAGQPEFVAVLCENACDLALASPDGCATAAEAVQLEAAAIPGKAAACAERMVDVRQRQFDVAKSDARAAAGEALIDAILAALDARQKTGVKPDEASYYKRALMVARAVKSDRAAALDAHLKDLEQAARLGIEIESLKKQLAASPENPAARLRLVRLLLVDLDDPAEAAKFLEGIQDAALVKYVPAAARPLEEAPELACLELGDWYRSLAETAPPAAKGPMFARAQLYYKRFLEMHTAEDINRAKAVAALQKIEAEVQGLGQPSAKPMPATPTKTLTSGKEIDLLALVDPTLDAVMGKWERRGASVGSAGQAPEASRFVLPVAIDGSYELGVTFVRTSGDDMVGIVAPVGSTSVLLALSFYYGKASGLSRVNGKPPDSNESTVTPGKLDNNRLHNVIVSVHVEADRAAIAVRLDGRPYINWKGPLEALSTSGTWRIRPSGALGLGASNCSIEFRSARLRMLSGEAKLLRPPGAKP